MVNITISTNKSLLDIDLIHSFLLNSYWAKNIPLETLSRSIENSLCFGIFDGKDQVGFARVVSDYTTFAYLADVFIIPERQGEGLGRFLLKSIFSHDLLQGLKRWHLVTKDAQGLYCQFGFSNPEYPERQMEIVVKNIYANKE